MSHDVQIINQQIADQVSFSQQTFELLARTPAIKTFITTQGNETEIQTLLSPIFNNTHAEIFISFFDEKNQEIKHLGARPKAEIHEAIQQQLAKLSLLSAQSSVSLVGTHQNDQWALFSLPVRIDPKSINPNTGYLVYGINTNTAWKHISGMQVSKNASIFLMQSNGQLMSSDGPHIPYQIASAMRREFIEFSKNPYQPMRGIQIEGVNYQFISKASLLGTYLISLYPEQRIIAKTNALAYTVFTYSLGLIIGLLVIIFVLIRYELIAPITRLARATEDISKGNYEFKSINRNKDELAMLEKGFERMSQHLKEKAGELKYLAFHDQWTGLPNRSSFYRDIDQLISQGQQYGQWFGFMYIDIDSFKQVNDKHGHEVGDQVLNAVAIRLTNALKTPGYFPEYRHHTLRHPSIYRLGGDDFVFLFAIDENSTSESKNHAKQLLKLFDTPIKVEESLFHLEANAGIAIYPEHGTDHRTLLKNADIAMHYSKGQGVSRSNLFDSSMSQHCRELMRIREALPHALCDDAIHLNFQPIFDGHRLLHGFEVLLRWTLEGEAISPDQFIPIAEESYQIINLGSWVIEESFRYINELNQRGYRLSCSINLSIIQLEHDDLITQLNELLVRYPLDPPSICFDISERMLMKANCKARAQLFALRAMNFHIAVDDFGTGHTSLSRLKSLPLNSLKIDNSIILNLGEDAINDAFVRATLAMAKALNLTVIAEGVEHNSDIKRLFELGCDYMQGYALAKPLDIEGFEAILRKQPQFEHRKSYSPSNEPA
jgi:diguanylate cyclase (GGDEF)-like protein